MDTCLSRYDAGCYRHVKDRAQAPSHILKISLQQKTKRIVGRTSVRHLTYIGYLPKPFTTHRRTEVRPTSENHCDGIDKPASPCKGKTPTDGLKSDLHKKSDHSTTVIASFFYSHENNYDTFTSICFGLGISAFGISTSKMPSW